MALKKIVTPEFRVSFPHVFKPSENNFGGDNKYSIVMLFDKGTDLTPLKEIVEIAISDKWGDKRPKGIRSPFRDGNEKDYDGYQDVIFCSATSKEKPGLVDWNCEPIIEQGEFYGGCYARATIVAFAYDVKGNRGVGLGLQNVQKLRDGAAFTGRTKAEDDFEPIENPDEKAKESKASENKDDLFNLD
jgi:hypothetical protein